jgi:RNA polymerase sigma factor (sigma-70 family)
MGQAGNRGGRVSKIEPKGEESVSRRRVVEVYTKFLGRLKQVAGGMGFGPADTEDILGEVFLEALQGKTEFRSEREARHWLLRVTVNRCLLEYRRRKRFRRAAEEILKRQERNSSAPQTPEDQIIQAEEMEAVRQGLQELEGVLLAPLVLRYFLDLNSSEIGEILSLNPNTVRSRLREGRLKLARKIRHDNRI